MYYNIIIIESITITLDYIKGIIYLIYIKLIVLDRGLIWNLINLSFIRINNLVIFLIKKDWPIYIANNNLITIKEYIYLDIIIREILYITKAFILSGYNN